MTFLELQKKILQTRKARSGVKNRTDYFDDCDWKEEEFWREVYKRALRVASSVVQHYEETCRVDKSEKISVSFGEQSKNTEKEISAYQKMYNLFEKQKDELSQLQQENRKLNKELEQVKKELARAKVGGRRKDYDKEAKIQLYKHEHPEASIRMIAKAIGCSTTTVQSALKAVKSDASGTLSMMNIPRDKKKLERIIENLLTVIEQDTNEKSRQIHLQSLRLHKTALDELKKQENSEKKRNKS